MKLAAKEIRRYVYLRTGELLPVAASGTGIALRVDPALAAQQYRLKGGAKADLVISGGSDVAVLYGAYAFVEKLGVRFELNGDVIPDGRIPLAIPALDEDWQPLFDKRGIQPFHDFPEGPDWWSADEWRLYLGQAVKLRMNFVGLHTYPFSNKDLGPEPLVWVGVPEDVNPDGTVRVADEASWYTTAKTMPYGCYAPGITGNYSFGASLVFPADHHGPEINGPDDFPMPKTPEAKVAMINRTGEFLRPIFAEARGRGIRIAVGTEAPLDIPPTALVRLREMGIDPASPEALHKLYTGMFTRIQRAFPVDSYWLWGHEGEIDEARVTLNVKQAHQALEDMGRPFGLGVCGWGWTAGHFPSLHRNLPPDIFFSAINGSAGHAPLSPNFGRVGDRSRWAIPWVEDDSVLTSIQPRAGRIRRDAADARKYGCDGLMGIFWRTRILSPALTALARAGWGQDGWTDSGGAKAALPEIEVDGGQIVSFLNNKVAGATVEPIYQTVRFGMNGYRFAVPDGDYRVILHFVEPAYKEAGKRVFGVKLQGRQVIEHLDVFGKVGGFTALKLPFEHIRATNGLLKIEFTPETEYPIIAAIEVEGGDVRRKINCGGPAYQDFAADPAGATPRDLPVADLYADWAHAQFGPEAGPPAAAIFSRLDGKFPAVSGWIRGPGAVVVHNEPWKTYQRQFAFVEEFAALRPMVRGAGSLERFDYWLNMFRATRSMGEFGSLRGELNGIMAAITRE
ncbi:MAG: malectin, partial [Akkermansiaceae bacterium]|nr:malectin [Akkermansiaceae bacterium]